MDPARRRKLHFDGKIPEVEMDGRGRRLYSGDAIVEMRRVFDAQSRKHGQFRPGRREGDRLQVIAVANYKGGSSKTTTATVTQAGVPYLLSIPIAVAVTMAIGAIVEVLIISRLYGRIFDTMLATWGISIAFYQLAVLTFGTVSPGIGMPQISVKIGAYSLAVYPLLMIGVAVLMLGFVYLLMTRSVYGMKARASIQVPEMARAIGISSARVNTMTFALGCGLAGFAGAVLLPIVPTTPSMGFAFVIKAFLTVVVAGPVTLTGSALAAIGLGGGASVTASFLTSVAGDAFFFIVTALLLWRYPLGISARWRRKL